MAEKKRIEIVNRKAGFNFHVEEKYVAGIALTGTEVKSIRQNNVNMGDAYCYMDGNELILKNMHISEFKQASFGAHEPLRDRHLLLTKKELQKLAKKAKTKGYSVFPIKLFENEKGIFKLEIGVGQGKKQHDKREDMKEKDARKEINASLKSRH